jgi:hypothetical protein
MKPYICTKLYAKNMQLSNDNKTYLLVIKVIVRFKTKNYNS